MAARVGRDAFLASSAPSSAGRTAAHSCAGSTCPCWWRSAATTASPRPTAPRRSPRRSQARRCGSSPMPAICRRWKCPRQSANCCGRGWILRYKVIGETNVGLTLPTQSRARIAFMSRTRVFLAGALLAAMAALAVPTAPRRSGAAAAPAGEAAAGMAAAGVGAAAGAAAGDGAADAAGAASSASRRCRCSRRRSSSRRPPSS